MNRHCVNITVKASAEYAEQKYTVEVFADGQHFPFGDKDGIYAVATKAVIDMYEGQEEFQKHILEHSICIAGNMSRAAMTEYVVGEVDILNE